MNKNIKLRAFPAIPNKNICLPIGTTLAVQYFFEKLNFFAIFGKYKSKGLDINGLLTGLVSYKLTENFSIKKASKWMNQDEVLDLLNLKSFNERVLYRTLETIGSNKEKSNFSGTQFLHLCNIHLLVFLFRYVLFPWLDKNPAFRIRYPAPFANKGILQICCHLLCESCRDAHNH